MYHWEPKGKREGQRNVWPLDVDHALHNMASRSGLDKQKETPTTMRVRLRARFRPYYARENGWKRLDRHRRQCAFFGRRPESRLLHGHPTSTSTAVVCSELTKNNVR